MIPPKRLNLFERYLTLWVGLCMILGFFLGRLFPSIIDQLRHLEFGTGNHQVASQINIPIAVLIWLMIIPMMMKVDFASVKGIGRRPRGLLITLFINWLVKPFSMALIAMPILVQVYFNSSLAYGLMRLFHVPYAVAAPGALIGASNFFELAVATAIALFGPESGAALATVVGVLVEVPVMLSVCSVCNRASTSGAQHLFKPCRRFCGPPTWNHSRENYIGGIYENTRRRKIASHLHRRIGPA